MRALNRALLARQMLLDRRSLSPLEALERLVGLQAQEPQAPYVALWSRLADFKPEQLSELISGRTAVRAALMRSTLHLVTTRDWHWLRPLMGQVLARQFRGGNFGKLLAGVDLDRVRKLGRKLLGERPLSRSELSSQLAARWPEADRTALAYAITYLEPVIQVPPRGLWRQSGQARWTTAEVWLGRSAARSHSDQLVTRYLDAFGPASVADLQAWSGLTRLGEMVERQRGRLRAFCDEHGRELFDVPRGPRPDPDTPAPPRFLAPFDNAVLSHADRTRIVDAAGRQFLNSDRLMRAFLLDGFVAGTWSLRGSCLQINPRRILRRADRSALAEEAHRMLGLLRPGSSGLDVRFASPA